MLSPYESVLKSSDDVSVLIDEQIEEPVETFMSKKFKKEKLVN